MRVRGLRGFPHEVRRAVLPRRHPLHRLRSRDRLPVSLGGVPGFDRHAGPRRHGDFSPRARGRFHLRVEEGGAGMGLAARAEAESPVDAVTQKGFVVTTVDAVVNWARTGSMWPMTFGLA